MAPNRKTGETLDVSAALKPRSGVGGPLVDRSSEKSVIIDAERHPC